MALGKRRRCIKVACRNKREKTAATIRIVLDIDTLQRYAEKEVEGHLADLKKLWEKIKNSFGHMLESSARANSVPGPRGHIPSMKCKRFCNDGCRLVDILRAIRLTWSPPDCDRFIVFKLGEGPPTSAG